jgi:hypothetical protein
VVRSRWVVPGRKWYDFRSFRWQRCTMPCGYGAIRHSFCPSIVRLLRTCSNSNRGGRSWPRWKPIGCLLQVGSG